MSYLLSKEHQVRKNREPKEEKRLAYNSTLAASTKPINKVSAKHRKVMKLDSECAELVMGRDGYVCIPCLWLDKKRDVAANVVHHIARKGTHRGVDVRFQLGYQVAICNECHASDHAQRGMTNKLTITAIGDGDVVVQTFTRGDKSAERTVGNYNPFAEVEG